MVRILRVVTRQYTGTDPMEGTFYVQDRDELPYDGCQGGEAEE